MMKLDEEIEFISVVSTDNSHKVYANYVYYGLDHPVLLKEFSSFRKAEAYAEALGEQNDLNTVYAIDDKR